jgi:hypothetical protein
MTRKDDVMLLIPTLCILVISVLLFSINRCCYRYPGFFYFEPVFLEFSLFLSMVRLGLKLQFNISFDAAPMKMMRSASIYGLVIIVILLSTSAIQYTPFQPIDKFIVQIEQYVHLDLSAVIAWLHTNGGLKAVANFAYNSLSYQLLVIPFLVLCFQRYDRLHQYYFLVLVSWLLGSMIYYFFPTMAPASVIDSPYFIESQRATGLKFWQLHHYIQPVTADGGMVAMPSFHVIWAWLCVNLLRPWPILFGLLATVNLILVAACVSLGWHYFLDVLGSTLILIVAHYIYRMTHRTAIVQPSRRSGKAIACPTIAGHVATAPLPDLRLTVVARNTVSESLGMDITDFHRP